MRNKGFALPAVLMLSALAMVLFIQVIQRTKSTTTSTFSSLQVQKQQNATQKAIAVVLSQLANSQPVVTELSIDNYQIKVDTTNVQSLLDVNRSSRDELNRFATKYALDKSWATQLIAKRPFPSVHNAINETGISESFSSLFTLYGKELDSYQISTQVIHKGMKFTASNTYKITLNADKPFQLLE